MNDYVVLFDSDAQPYIVHAFWNRKNNGIKKDHKYYAKIKNGLKTRYFYTKQEWDAFQRKASEKWNGGTSAKQYDEAHKKAVQAKRDLAATKKAIREKEEARNGDIVKFAKDRMSGEAQKDKEILGRAQDRADRLDKYDKLRERKAREAYRKSIVGKIVKHTDTLIDTIPDNSEWFEEYMYKVGKGQAILSKPILSLFYAYEKNFDPAAYSDPQYMSDLELWKRRGYAE